MMRCLLGFSTLQTMMLVSRLPLATSVESGDQATQFTLAVWKPHSSLVATWSHTHTQPHTHTHSNR